MNKKINMYIGILENKYCACKRPNLYTPSPILPACSSVGVPRSDNGLESAPPVALCDFVFLIFHKKNNK